MSQTFFVVVGPCQRKVGVVASTFQEFLEKCRTKFKFKKDEEIFVTLVDNTEVDEEYYEVLSNDTELHVSLSKQYRTSDFINQLAVFLHMCLERQPKIHKRVKECFQKPESYAQATKLLELLAKAADVIPVSSRDRDSDWFKGLDTKFKTKEAVMRNSAETRMRGYLMRTKQELLVGDLPADSPYRKALMFFKQQLCNTRIEKSRTILPSLKTALSGPRASSVNLSYFHDLLFQHQNVSDHNSSGNLKFVHIACHIKKPHELQCDSKKVYLCLETTSSEDVVDGPQVHQHPPYSMMTRFRRKRELFELNRNRSKIARGRKKSQWQSRYAQVK